MGIVLNYKINKRIRNNKIDRNKKRNFLNHFILNKLKKYTLKKSKKIISPIEFIILSEVKDNILENND